MHPYLWKGFRFWHYRTWPTQRINLMLARAFLRKGRPAFNFWRSHARIHALGPFLYARMTHSKIVRWRAEVAFRMRTHAICKLFPFRRLNPRNILVSLPHKVRVGLLILHHG